MAKHRGLASLTVVALLVGACSGGSGTAPGGGDGSTSSIGGDTTASATSATTTTISPSACAATTPAAVGGDGVEFVSGDDAAALVVALSQAAFECAADVVVVSDADLDRASLAARLAAVLGAPMLVDSPLSTALVTAELERLSPQRVTVVGGDVTAIPPAFTEVVPYEGDLDALALRLDELIGVQQAVELPSPPGAATVAAVVDSISEGTRLRPPPTTTTTTTAPAITTTTTLAPTTDAVTSTTAEPSTGESDAAPEALEEPPAVVTGTGNTGEVWLVDLDSPLPALAAAVAVGLTGGLMGLVDGSDLRRIPEVGRAIQASDGGARMVHFVGDVPAESAEWQLPVITEGSEIPGGGFLVFPGRRLVALYGHPGVPALGSLGEQGMRQGLERIETFREAYEGDGLDMLPTWEIIATIADATPGSDGDYSAESSVELLREWVDFAARHDMYVVLDLQPGRSDFLTQAKLYEELLLEPNVGLALDPEWRLKPDQVHLRQIGSVRAAEVNTVVDWLAELVRENALPQKLLLLHQFRLDMLINRENIRTPSELAVVIQMDGHGDLPTKLGTWGWVTAGWEGFGWRYGWKNFFDEDRPTPSAEDVLSLTPQVVFVSFQ
jgi:hypothetical protein